MSITEFLEARITQDEVTASLRGWHAEDCDWLPNESGYSYPCDCGVPERMAAECAAKRAIVAGIIPERDPQTGDPDYDPLWVLRELAAVYADHPDYRQEWAK